MLSTYTDAIEATLHVVAGTAGVLTVVAPLTLVVATLRHPARRLTWRLDARRNRTS